MLLVAPDAVQGDSVILEGYLEVVPALRKLVILNPNRKEVSVLNSKAVCVAVVLDQTIHGLPNQGTASEVMDPHGQGAGDAR